MGLDVSVLQIRRMEEERKQQFEQLEAACAALRSTSDALTRAHLLSQELQLRNSELESRLALQRTGSCQNVCCKGLDFSKVLLDFPPVSTRVQDADPIGTLMDQMWLTR